MLVALHGATIVSSAGTRRTDGGHRRTAMAFELDTLRHRSMDQQQQYYWYIYKNEFDCVFVSRDFRLSLLFILLFYCFSYEFMMCSIDFLLNVLYSIIHFIVSLLMFRFPVLVPFCISRLFYWYIGFCLCF